MDSPEAARMLGVAESEIVDIRQHAGWWEARHHDMANHEEIWRQVAPAPLAVVGESGPELVDLPAGSEVVVPVGSTADELVAKVPDGTVQDVLDWVGDDHERALAAQVVELDRDAPRSTLLATLEKLAH